MTERVVLAPVAADVGQGGEDTEIVRKRALARGAVELSGLPSKTAARRDLAVGK